MKVELIQDGGIFEVINLSNNKYYVCAIKPITNNGIIVLFRAHDTHEFYIPTISNCKDLKDRFIYTAEPVREVVIRSFKKILGTKVNLVPNSNSWYNIKKLKSNI